MRVNKEVLHCEDCNFLFEYKDWDIFDCINKGKEKDYFLTVHVKNRRLWWVSPEHADLPRNPDKLTLNWMDIKRMLDKKFNKSIKIQLRRK